VAVDLATLAIKVESIEVQLAQRRLESLANAGAKTERQVSSSYANMAVQMAKLAGAITAAYSAYRMFSNVISIGMKMETMNTVMMQVAKNMGIASETVKYFVEQVKVSGVTTTESMSAVTKAMQLGLDLNQMKEFATRVRDVAVGARDAEGNLLNTSQTLARDIQGISRGKKENKRTKGKQEINTKEAE